MKAEIISIGSEILLGEITDTNASYLAGQLPALGIDLYWISQVGDNPGRLLEVLRRAWERSDLIITGGGLGPTDDDITRETIARLMKENMKVDPALESALRTRFQQYGLDMPLSNLKQAALIPSARPIPNSQGTAPGWWVEKDGRILLAMPGPSREMREMWQKEVKPRLQQSATAVIVSRTFKTFGLSEAKVGEMVSSLSSSASPTLGIYAKADGIHLRLTAKAANQQEAEEIIAVGEVTVRTALDEYIWGTDSDTLESITGQLLSEKGLTLAVMEDYTGGQLTNILGNVPGSEAFFTGGLVAASNRAKAAFGIDIQAVSACGNGSPEMAELMAQSARTLLKADIGLSVTGAKDTEGTDAGAAYIGLADGKHNIAFSRPRRRHIITAALFELRNLLISPDKHQ
ncbi:MAG: CinA family nicotinamide mononucleotide deamidase-related protein [Dehalococcoidales bacterium]|nr:CinA family nicotinamide mononucleotide deamidase-related protein [Dehalococcoidales bacterium]